MRPRMLFLSHRLPFPPHSGAAARTYNILRELCRDYTIDALCFDRVDATATNSTLDARIGGLAAFASCEVFPIPQQESTLRFARDHVCSVLTGRAYTWYVHQSAAFEKRLAALLGGRKYDIVHVDSLDLARFLPRLPLSRVACTHHNIESELLARRASTESGLARRQYLRYQAQLVRRLEREWAPKVALNLCTSPEDAELLASVAPRAHSAVIANGVDDEYFAPQDDRRDQGLVFVGGTSWYPNKDALDWFVAEILPALREAGVSSAVTWVGRITERERQDLAGVTGLKLTGYVEDVRPYLAAAQCFVAPIRVGGGTRLKILDAWAMGTPVIGTSAAMEGVQGVDGSNYLLADSPRAFVTQVKRILSDPPLLQRLGANGRRTVEAAYSWKRIGATLRERYESLSAVSIH